jgi:hypothetical protein
MRYDRLGYLQVSGIRIIADMIIPPQGIWATYRYGGLSYLWVLQIMLHASMGD